MASEVVPANTAANTTTAVATKQDVMSALAEVGAGKYSTETAFNSVSSASGFLPRLTLMNATSEQVKMDKIKSGYYGLVRSAEDVTDLTKEVNVIPFAWRPKALNMKDKKKVVAAYDPQSSLFKNIAALSETSNSNCMFGPEFLIWIPSISAWATFHMASKTARRAAGDVRPYLEKKQGMTLKSTFIRQGTNSWWGPVVTTCSVQLDWPTDIQDIKDTIEKFNNVPQTEDVTDVAPADVADRPR